MVPIPLQWLARWTPAAIHSGVDLLRRPARSTDLAARPDHPLAARHSRWRQRLDKRLHRPVIARMDELSQPRWQRRFEAHGLAYITDVVVGRPVIAVTLHYGAVALLRAFLQSRGIQTAVVVNDRMSAGTRRTNRLAASDPRSMLAYLVPGKCLVIAADFLRGRTVTVPLPAVSSDGSISLASGPFRLARLSGAILVPVLISERSRWRYVVDVCAPVPDATLADGDAAAARHVVDALWPLVLRDPRQARDKLVEATEVIVAANDQPAPAAMAGMP